MIKRGLAVVAGWMLAVSAHAIECAEQVVYVGQMSNGKVYFHTSATCGWCSLDWTNEKAIDRAFSLMLTAKAANKPVHFIWPSSITDCSVKHLNGISPEFVKLN